MLNAPAEFPFPGSHARLAGLIWRVHQHNADGTATLIRGGEGASFTRRAPIDALEDPALETLGADGLDDRGRRQLAWLRAKLTTANTVVFASLRSEMAADARLGLVPGADGAALSGLLQRLGWSKIRNLGAPMSLSIWGRRPQAHVAA